ncbi:hypothetical protein OG871_14575 [Kitasatospora sp. NBC_00374]|uniref:hypothetical protein n=1 Tax=Kitasatospora sp. NBC_00374 TaxID=2975964 RepID=UPI003249D518
MSAAHPRPSAPPASPVRLRVVRPAPRRPPVPPPAPGRALRAVADAGLVLAIALPVYQLGALLVRLILH